VSNIRSIWHFSKVTIPPSVWLFVLSMLRVMFDTIMQLSLNFWYSSKVTKYRGWGVSLTVVYCLHWCTFQRLSFHLLSFRNALVALLNSNSVLFFNLSRFSSLILFRIFSFFLCFELSGAFIKGLCIMKSSILKSKWMMFNWFKYLLNANPTSK